MAGARGEGYQEIGLLRHTFGFFRYRFCGNQFSMVHHFFSPLIIYFRSFPLLP
jgi:hypothetical protein